MGLFPILECRGNRRAVAGWEPGCAQVDGGSHNQPDFSQVVERSLGADPRESFDHLAHVWRIIQNWCFPSWCFCCLHSSDLYQTNSSWQSLLPLAKTLAKGARPLAKGTPRNHQTRGESMPHAQVNELNIHYSIQGQGQPLLLIMGLGGPAAAWDLEFVQRMAADYQVITYDNRGTGRSDKPDEPYSISLFASDAVGLLSALVYLFSVEMTLSPHISRTKSPKNCLLASG